MLHWFKVLFVILAMLLPASLQGKLAPQPETAIESHDFEGQDFHTYFVGEAGVWVHNMGRFICEQWFLEYRAFKKAANGDHWKAFDDAVASKAAALKTQKKKLPKHQTNSIYNEVLTDYLDEGGDLASVPDLPNAAAHEIPIDKAFREQHGRKVGGHWSEGDPDLPAGARKTSDRIMLDDEAQVEYKGFTSKPGESLAEMETRIKNEVENAFEKRTKGQGLDELVIDKTNLPNATDAIITNAIERAVGNRGVTGVKYWIFDGANLVEHIVR